MIRDYLPLTIGLRISEDKIRLFIQTKTYKIMANLDSKIQVRSLSEIAREIKGDWQNWRNSYAADYLRAMSELNSIDDDYFADSGKSVVLYFLANAQSWRGEVARRIKAELKQMAGIK